MLFLFPIASGPYSATHGPVSALRAIRDCSVLRLSIAFAALSLFRIRADKFLLRVHTGIIPKFCRSALLNRITF